MTGVQTCALPICNEVLSAIKSFDLVPANDNGAGQIVAAGSLEQIDKLVENAPAGSRVRPLAVAGAFHTHFMQSAVSHVAGFVEKISVHEPTSQLLSNKDGAVVAGGKDAIDRIVNQIANPVRWDLCMESLVQLGVDRKSTRLNSSHIPLSRMPSSA